MRSSGEQRTDELVFFLHLPKTGGVSLNEYLYARYEPPEVLPVPDQEDNLRTFRELSPTVLSRIRLVSGHYWFGQGDRGVHDFLAPDPSVLTLLREPVARTVSVYQFVLANPQLWLAKRIMRPDMRLADVAGDSITEEEVRELRAMSLEEFVVHPVTQGEIGDLQARVIVGTAPGNGISTFEGHTPARRLPKSELLTQAKSRLDGFAVVGLTERFGESVDLLAHTFRWPKPAELPRLNAAGQPSGEVPVSDAARAAISERVEVDAQVYEHARALFERRVAELDAEL